MRVLHISWEYPPVVYGGLGRHVHALAEEQARQGHEVSVLTQRPTGSPDREVLNGVGIYRVPPPLPQVPREPEALVTWAAGLDGAMARAAQAVIDATSPEAVHAHDWVVTQAAAEARELSGAPLVSTIHATEAGRHQGWISGPLSTHIHQLEYRLTHHSQRVITCSTAMRMDVMQLFEVARSDVDVIPNGIDLNAWQVAGEDSEAARRQWAPRGNLAVFVGRLEWEKGVHTLLEALPLVAADDLHLVIAGTGTYEKQLLELAAPLIEQERVSFTGWLPQAQLQALQAAADVIVIPSLYEPFGLVALEAAALGVPAVVANTGGLSEIVDGGRCGYVFEPDNPVALAHQLDAALGNRTETAHRLSAMRARLETDYRWDRIAERTISSYQHAINEAARTPKPLNVQAPEPPVGNLLTPRTT